MRKDRFEAFFDAVMAIIMTIVVLEFAVPKGTDWSNVKGVMFQVVVYAISFFYLGMMWMNIHTLWHNVEYITRGVMWVNMIMLFFSSMLPFWVVYLGRNFFALVPQLLYGIDVLLITITNFISAELLRKYNPALNYGVEYLRCGMILDISTKLIGIIVALIWFPPAITISVIVAMVVLSFNFTLLRRKKRAYKQRDDETTNE